jgi:hypothetical protein
MEHDLFSRLRSFKITLALAFAAGLVLSHKLWLTDRFFPHAPLFSFLPQLPWPIDWVLLISSIVLLLITAAHPSPRKFFIAFCITFGVLLLLDQNRWQPWVFQYFFMILMLCFVSWRREHRLRQTQILYAERLIMAGIYLYSGLQKINPQFMNDTYPWLMEPVTKHMEHGLSGWLYYLGYTLPAIEIFIGIGLLLKPARKAAMIFAIVMHVLILLDMSPFGHNYNVVIWPWNTAMIIFNLVLFKKDTSPISSYRLPLRFWLVKGVFLLFWIMPFFSFINIWDSYLSSSLYSGNTSNGVIYMTDDVRAKLPKEVEQYVTGSYNQNQLSIKYWAMMEMGVPGYPEQRVFKKVKNELEQYATTDSSDVFLMYTERAGLLNSSKTEIIE